MNFLTNFEFDSLTNKINNSLESSSEALEDFKNRQILIVAQECVNKMLVSVQDKLDSTHSVIVSLIKIKDDIESILKLTKISASAVIDIIKTILQVKEAISCVASLAFVLIELAPLLNILLLFIQ